MKRYVIAIILVVVLAGCGSLPPRPPIVSPPPPPATSTLFLHICSATPCVSGNEPHKISGAEVAITRDGTTFIEHADLAGNYVANGTAGPRRLCVASDGYKTNCLDLTLPLASPDVFILLERDVPPTLPVRVDGRFWITDAGTFRPVFQSGLSLLVRGPAERAAFLDQTRELGFNGIRVFAADLGWANQTPAAARAALPGLLDDAAARGLYVYVSALQGGGYDIEAHLREIASICSAHPNCLLEVANEIGHPTQSDIAKDPPRLLALARRVIPSGAPWTLGAGGTDEAAQDGSYQTDGGLFNDAHLDRGRDLYNQVRRLREIAGISEATRKPAMSGEPIGIAEVPMPGRQRFWGDDALRFSFAYGVLCRGFELGCVFHSEQGLQAQVLGPNTTAAAREFIAGWHAIPTDARLAFVNAGWAGSPVKGANFDTGIVRAYSFLDSGSHGWTVLVGVRGDPAVEWGSGFVPVRVVVDRPGVRVVEIRR